MDLSSDSGIKIFKSRYRASKSFSLLKCSIYDAPLLLFIIFFLTKINLLNPEKFVGLSIYMLNDPQGTEQITEEELSITGYDTDISVIDEDEYSSNSTVELGKKQSHPMILGIIGCGAIAGIITDFALEGKFNAELKYFYDTDQSRAKKLASKVDGIAVLNFEDMLNNVDLVIEAASPQAVIKYVPRILRAGKDVIIMSIGALIGQNFREKLEKIASINHCNIHTPSGAIDRLDGIKATTMGKITSVSFLPGNPPQSLEIEK